MKKHRKTVIFFAIFGLLGLLGWWLFRTPDPVDFVEEMLGVELPRGEVLTAEDSHDNFLGDGHTYIVIQFDEDISENLTGEFWHGLPMEESLAKQWRSQVGVIAENGCWYFYDRHTKAADPADASRVSSHGSWNFTAAVYDADTKTLYYFAFDT